MNATLIEKALILDAVDGTEKGEVLPQILQAACGEGLFPKKVLPVLRKKILEREGMGSTGIGNGVAVPHVKADELESPWLVVARSVDGIEFESIDGRPVHTLFMLGSPAAQAEDHLQCLRWISTLARDADFRRFFLDAADGAAIRELLVEMGSRGGP